MKLSDLNNEETAVKNVYSDFVGAMEHINRADYEKSVREADKVFLGEVFSEEDVAKLEKDGIPVCKTNKGAVNSIRYASILTASRPEISATPIGGSDAGLSRLIKRDFSKVQRANHANKRYFDVVLDTVKEGLGWIEVYPQRFNGLQSRTVIEHVPSGMVYIDPATRDNSLDDFGFKIKARRITEQIAEDVHGLKKEELRFTAKRDDLAVPSHQLTKTVDSEPGGRYSDVPSGEQDSQENKLKEFFRDIWEIAYYQPMRSKKTLWIQVVNGEIKDRETKPPENEKDRWEEVEIFFEDLLYVFVVGKKLVKWKLNPWGKDHNGKPIDNLIPLPNIPVKKAYPRGNLFFAIPALQELSKRRGQSIAIVAATSGSPILALKGILGDIGEAEKKLQQNRRVIEFTGTPENKPAPLFPAAPDISRIFELENRAQKDADDAWQLNPALKGEAETSKMSGKLNLLLKEAGLEGSAYFMVALEEFFRKIAVCVISMQLDNQLSGYWERLLEEEDYEKDEKGEATDQLLPQIKTAVEKLQQGNLTILNWDIAVQTGSSLPSSRWAKLEFMLEMSKNPIHPESLFDHESILDFVDFAGKSDLIKRKSQLVQVTQQLQQSQGQIEGLSQELKKTHTEVDAKMAEINKITGEFKTMLLVKDSEVDIAVAKEKEKWKIKFEALKDSINQAETA